MLNKHVIRSILVNGGIDFCPTCAASLHIPLEPVQIKTGTLEEITQAAINSRVTAFGGNITKAARSLQITRRTLYRRFERNNIPLEIFKTRKK